MKAQNFTYKCTFCGSSLYYEPIKQFLQCPRCHTIHYLLSDGVLCTKTDYDNRKNRHGRNV